MNGARLVDTWLAEAEADHLKFSGDLRRVESMLQEYPADKDLLARYRMIKQHVEGLAEGIRLLKENGAAIAANLSAASG
jgi:hypothetical protein